MNSSKACDSPSITVADIDDVPEILAMIKELADYEHEPDKVQATEESLRRTLTLAPSKRGHAQHTNPGYARCFILRTPENPSEAYRTKAGATQPEQPGAVAGMALFFHNYSTWRSKPGIYLEDLFVRPQYRGRAWGRSLIKALAQEVVRIDGGRLEWCCLKWNQSSLDFYKSLGAARMDDWVSLRLDGDALLQVATS